MTEPDTHKHWARERERERERAREAVLTDSVILNCRGRAEEATRRVRLQRSLLTGKNTDLKLADCVFDSWIWRGTSSAPPWDSLLQLERFCLCYIYVFCTRLSVDMDRREPAAGNEDAPLETFVWAGNWWRPISLLVLIFTDLDFETRNQDLWVVFLTRRLVLTTTRCAKHGNNSATEFPASPGTATNSQTVSPELHEFSRRAGRVLGQMAARTALQEGLQRGPGARAAPPPHAASSGDARAALHPVWPLHREVRDGPGGRDDLVLRCGWREAPVPATDPQHGAAGFLAPADQLGVRRLAHLLLALHRRPAGDPEGDGHPAVLRAVLRTHHQDGRGAPVQRAHLRGDVSSALQEGVVRLHRAGAHREELQDLSRVLREV